MKAFPWVVGKELNVGQSQWQARSHGLLIHDDRWPGPWLYDRKKERAGTIVSWEAKTQEMATTVLLPCLLSGDVIVLKIKS